MTTPLRIGPSGPPTTIPSGSGDHKVLASPSDTTPGYLLPVKLVGGANITLVLVNPGGDESVRIDATGGAVAGPPNALAYYDALGAISGDALLTAIPLDQFGSPQIRDLRQGLGVNPPGAVFRQGAWQADGDAQNIQGEGIVVYGPAPNGLQDVANGTIGRVKYDRFQIRMIIGGVDIGSAWRVDPTHEFFTDDAGVMTAEIVRATGAAFFGTVRTGGASGPVWTSGAGDPNAALVPGTIGDLFSNTAGGAGTTFWVKEAGAPNSTGGWVPTRIPTLHADNGASAFPLPTFPAVTTVATTPVVAIAAGQRILPTSRVLAEITAGGGTMAAAVFANPIVPPGAPIIIDYTETTVAGSPKQALSSAGAEVTLPPGTYTFSLLVTSTALVTGSVPATGVGYPIPPAVLTVMVLSP